MRSRIRSIIEILIKEDREYTAKELSLKLDVSEKTVRNEIADYCGKEEKYPVKIASLKRGYRIQDTNMDGEELQLFLQKLSIYKDPCQISAVFISFLTAVIIF